MQILDHKLDELYSSLISELTRAMALPQTDNVHRVIEWILGGAILRFSKLLLDFDAEIEHKGPVAGVQSFLPHFIENHEVRGEEIIPRSGPLLIVSNHPAAFDSLIISAHVNRSDYKIITSEIPPYHYLPHVLQHVIFSPPVKDTVGRMQTVRHAIHHLKEGGALLIFPRGRIESDPAFMPDPGAEFDQWSRSLEILLRRVPQTRVLVTIVGGVIAPAAMRHPITWFRKARSDRQRLAFMYQALRQILSGKELYGLTPRVTFGEVLSELNRQQILPEIEQSARRTLAQHMAYFKYPTPIYD